jgi:arylsulfatase A-like enzyme
MSYRRNLLHIICHDLGRHLHCYGRPDVGSPNLDALAAEGVRFEHCYTASPPCSPARSCIMTGRYAHSSGQIGLAHRGFGLPESQRTLVDYLNDAGYLTANIGLQHERVDPMANRYQFDDHETANCEVVAEKAARFFANHRGQQGAPFYFNLGFSEVHLPFTRPEYRPDDRTPRICACANAPSSVCVPGWLPDNQGVREELARFNGCIRFMDEAVGRILQALEESRLDRNTLVLFTTDHGMAFPRAKGTLYDPGIGTALILRRPKEEGRDRRAVSDLISSIDIAPTLLEAAGVAAPAEMQGRSFLRLLTGEAYEPRECVFSEKNFHDCYDPVRAVRTGRYKYLRSFERRRNIVLASDLQRSSASAEMWPWARRARPAEELYDLEADPWEMHNLAGRPEVAAVRAGLAQRVVQWMTDTDDPLLRGALTAPAGARVDPPEPVEEDG